MTAPFTSVFTPKAAELPPDTTLSTVLADLADNHVAAPKGKDQTELAAIAADARSHGIPLSVVVIPGNPGHDSSLRDLATEVGKTEHGTVAVFSDDFMGTYSDSISRVRLEWAEDGGKWQGGQTTVAVREFVNRLEQPEGVSWTAITSVLLAGAVVLIGGLYLVKRRRAEPELAQVGAAGPSGDRDSAE